MYYFFLGETLLPIAPSEMKTKIRNQNKTISLINDSEVNILKDAGLTEISFEVLLPNVKYPFAVYPDGFKDASYYLSIIEKFKTSKKPFQFIVSRKLPSGRILSRTNMKVSLEDYEIKESAKDGFDFAVNISLKQYKSFGVKTAQIKETKVKKDSTRDSKDSGGDYTIKSGDTLWGISKKQYGTGTEHGTIYDSNKKTIEDAAKENGKKSSSNGWWIYPGTKIEIPELTNADKLKAVAVSQSKSSGGGGGHSFSTVGGGGGHQY